VIDEFMTGAQPCWKLIGAGSVGAVPDGIPVVRALRDDPRWREQRGCGVRGPAWYCRCQRVVFAEVWPSWVADPRAKTAR